jgi:hypothetical protein
MSDSDDQLQVLTASGILHASSYRDGDMAFIKLATQMGPARIEWPFDDGARMIAAVRTAQTLAFTDRKRLGKPGAMALVTKKVAQIGAYRAPLGEGVVLALQYPNGSSEDVRIPLESVESLVASLVRIQTAPLLPSSATATRPRDESRQAGDRQEPDQGASP